MSEIATGLWLLDEQGRTLGTEGAAGRLAPLASRPGEPFADVFAPSAAGELARALERARSGERVALELDLAGGRGCAAVVLASGPAGTRAIVLDLASSGALGGSAVEAVAHGVSHDLGAHVRSLASFAGFLRDDAGAALPPAAHDDLERIEGALARLRAGLAGLVAYLRGPREARGEASLRACALEAASGLGAGSSRVAVEGGDARVPVAPDLLRGLVRAILENALERGAARVRVLVSRGGGRATVSVGDDGPGLGPDERRRALEPFTRLRPRAPGEVHPGLGLATVVRALRARGGTLALGPSDLGGLSVRLDLPDGGLPDGGLPDGGLARPGLDAA